MSSTATPAADSAADSASSAAASSSASLRTATLEALGYVCEEMGRRDDDVLEQDAVNSVLTAVVAGMRRDERDAGVRLAATRALCNALEFAAANFESADERAYLMQVMCEGAALAPEARAREAAFECLVKVAAQHYEKLEPFMRDLFAVTARAVGNGGETVGPDGNAVAADGATQPDPENTEDVAKQAIEFWCTVADEEADLDDDAAAGVPGAANANKRFVAQAAPALVPLLLAQLTKQEEGQDADDGAWNLSMAAGTALGLVARAAKDAVVPLVVPFVTANIGKQQSAVTAAGIGGEDSSWRYREAATFAFGSILEGPSPSSLAALAKQGLPLLLAATRDPSSQVRHTTAWAIGRVFEFVARGGGDEYAGGSQDGSGAGGSLSSLLPAAALPQAVAALLAATRDEAHVADKACYAIAQLAEAAEEEAEDAAAEASSSGASPVSPLAPHLQEIMAGLLQLADRASGSPDAASARAAGSAYEALNDVVRASPAGSPAGAQLVAALIPVMLQKLATTLGPAAAAAAASADARARRAELQSLLCGVLTVVLQRLAAADEVGKAAAAPHADSVMEALLAVFRSADDGSSAAAKGGDAAASAAASSSSSSSSATAAGGAVVHEEALLAAGALSYVVGQRFAAYLPALAPVLEAGLAATRAPAVCAAAVGVLGDVARAVNDEALAPWGDVLMAALLRAVQSPETPRDVKPPILSAFGDVALALGPRFEPYLGHVLPTLAAAAQLASQAAAAAAAASSSGDGDTKEEDEDAAEYAAMLRSGVAEAYAGVFNGMATGDARGAAALAPAAPAALDFCAAVLGAAPTSTSTSSADGGAAAAAAPPAAADSSARRAAIALVGDVATAVPGCGPLFAARPGLGAAVAAAAAGAGGFSSSGGGSGTGEGSGDSADDARAITDAGRWALQAIQKACAA